MGKVRKHDPDGVALAIKRAAVKLPQLRVGQIIASAVYEGRETFDPFNVEDRDMILLLNEYAEQYGV